ncbi:molecular chaperone TorD family protein [Enterovibrio sp. ZSDZ42]|uniref:Molecular chaperone TorD family protein n=1 Tax=Enterovibrio gelatinilyticus TaxID=2899819 RepID=A0ABT5QZ47_9GAMM|nr:molecular chaperone TorD family protein [Enterovibrio sp. ZSDZ42]MDD1792895.1 molecular chaperone TorD family protein [Enterovibrio sp. ZSDZ42]
MAMQDIAIEDVTNEDNQIRQSIYGLLAHLFRQAPDEQSLDWLSTLETEGDEQPAGMAAAWSVLKLTASNTTPTQAADEYQLMFIGVGRGEVVPFGSWYLTGSLMELPLALLREDLRRLGYERQDGTKEPEDHFAALLEVMAMLVEEANEAEQAYFFNRHIAAWFERLCEDTKRAHASVFYAAVAELAQRFLMIEKTRFTQRPW